MTDITQELPLAAEPPPPGAFGVLGWLRASLSWQATDATYDRIDCSRTVSARSQQPTGDGDRVRGILRAIETQQNGFTGRRITHE